MPMTRLAGAVAAALLVAACSSGGGDATPSGSSAPAPATSSAAPTAPTTTAPAPSGSSSPTDASTSPSAPETILASLCDKVTDKQQAIIEAALKPDYTVSQLVDVRTDDDGRHVILGFVEGPGMAVIAQWTGTGLTLEGLASLDEFAEKTSTAALGTPDTETEQLLLQTVKCYSLVFGPDS